MPEKERPSDATLAEWIRYYQRTGRFQKGKLIYKRGGLRTDSLSEKAQIPVEEDYRVCVRLLGRAGEPKKGRKGGESSPGQRRLFQ